MKTNLKKHLITAATALSMIAGYATAAPHKIVAITQIVDHPSLNEARRGIVNALSDAGYKSGISIKLIEDSAQGNIVIASQIAQKLVSLKPDIIIPISTPSAQTVYNKAKTSAIPIVFSTVTNPVSAGIAKNLEERNSIITGVIDAEPLDDGIELIKKFLPQTKKLGVIYNAGEANSVSAVKELRNIAKDKNLDIVVATAANSNEVVTAARALIGKVDAIYLPSDNTVWASMKPLIKITLDNHIPVFSGDPDSARQGVVAAIGYRQYDVGYTAGTMAAQILKGEKKVSDIKISKPKNKSIYINQLSLEKLLLKIPEGLGKQNITIIE